ncbi:MAG: DUF309 domain-containing protein [Sulfurovaceae bacterium]|nr:DUF309 domain-containing protein [Sulfurovaceae bacterium]
MNLNNALQKYIILLESKEYYEAHHMLEQIWLKMKKEDHPYTNLARGLINAAVAFEHIKRNTPTAMTKARKTFAGYLKYRHICRSCDKNFSLACQKADEIATRAELLP